MILTQLIQDLWEHGNVTVGGQVQPFDPGDLQQSVEALRLHYEQDFLEMPFTAPAFDPVAALWSASALYHALQLVLLRDLGDKAIDVLIPPFPAEKSPEAVYSADLMLRYLPAVLSLSKGLAPGDALVTCLKALALEWPFSSVGMELAAEPDLSLILGHPSLRSAYRDRVIEHRDTRRLTHPAMALLVQEAIGGHKDQFWPDLREKNTSN